MKQLLLPFLTVLAFAGCASTDKKLSVEGPKSDFPSYGIIIGEMIPDTNGLSHGIKFKDQATGELLTVVRPTKFFLRMKPGKYQLYSFGGMNHNYKPSSSTESISFEVKPSEIRYIGAFLFNARENQNKVNELRNQDAIRAKHKYMGYSEIFGKEIEFPKEVFEVLDVDHFQDVRADFLSNHPEYAGYTISR